MSLSNFKHIINSSMKTGKKICMHMSYMQIFLPLSAGAIFIFFTGGVIGISSELLTSLEKKEKRKLVNLYNLFIKSI